MPESDADGLGARGARLWSEMRGDGLSAAHKVLLEEACRIADRLDTLNDFLTGREDAWMKFHARNDDGSIVEVVVDKALAEARQQATALKQILAELRQSGAAKEQPGPKEAGSDELAKRRDERRRAAGL